jgi:hypothetical protein
VLGAYVRTLSPTVAGGDSGELIAAAYTLGVPHPPGYPLYTLLGKLFTLLPVGTIAWRVNLLSAVCGAGAATLLFLTVARWARSAWAALASASLFAFAPTVWPHAVTAEVFALNNLFAAGLFYLTLRFWENRSFQIACILFAWIGLGLSNHHTLIFYAIPAALFVLVHGGHEMRQPRRLAVFALCGLVGLLPYAYLPLASASTPLMSWGDQTTLEGFFTHFFRREYGTFSLGIADAGSEGLLVPRIRLYISGAFAGLLWVGPVLAAAGVTLMVRERTRPLVWWWVGAFCFFLLAFNYLANTPLDAGISRWVEERFWQQPHLLLCAFAGLGLAALTSRLGSAGRLALPGAALVLAIAQPAIHFREQDKRGDTQLREFAKATLDSVAPGALLLEFGDQIFGGLRYMQIVEGYRTDVRVLDQMLLAYTWHHRLATRHFPDVVLPGRLLPGRSGPGVYGMKTLFDANRERFPIYLLDVAVWDDARDSYTPWPTGIVDQIFLKTEEPPLARWVESARASFARVDPEALARHSRESWEWLTLRYYWKQVGKHALALARRAGERDDRAALERARVLMEDVLARSPEAPHDLHRDLGIVYFQLSSYDPSLTHRMRQEFETYLRWIPPAHPDVPKIRQILEQVR